MMTDRPHDDILMTWKDFDTFVKVLREELPTEPGEKQNFKGDVQAMAAHLLEKVLDAVHMRESVEKEIKALHSVEKFERFRMRIYMLLFRTYMTGRDSRKGKDDDEFILETFRQVIREAPAEQLGELGSKRKKK
jgi:hypothetical protein